MFNSKYGTFLTVILVIAIIAIIVLLGFFGYDMYQKYYIEKKSEEIINQFENQGNNDEEEENITENTTTGNVQNPYEQIQNTIISGGNNGGSSTITYEGYVVVGTIEIPATGIHYPIVDKITKRSLEIATVLVYPTTSENGEPILNQRRNTTIAGHNYRNGTFFSNNSKLKEGDLIYITDTSGRKITYEIYQTQILSESDSSYLNRDTNGAREISLTTCTEDASTRLVIFAREKQ